MTEGIGSSHDPGVPPSGQPPGPSSSVCGADPGRPWPPLLEACCGEVSVQGFSLAGPFGAEDWVQVAVLSSAFLLLLLFSSVYVDFSSRRSLSS